MTTKTCDRCGAEIREFSWQAMKFPTYSILKADINLQGVVTIDLDRKKTISLR